MNTQVHMFEEIAVPPLLQDPVARTPSAPVSWSAVFAGAAGAGALSLILLVLGTGLGLSVASPWAGQGLSGVTFGTSTIIWVTLTQIAAAGMGGYLAGRLRGTWADTHIDEVYFRDTAHGFLAWALATIVTAGLLTSAVSSVVAGGTQAAVTTATTAAAGTALAAMPAKGSTDQPTTADRMSDGYFVDTLFRADASGSPPAAPSPSGDSGRTTGEATRILGNATVNGSLSPEDTRYLAQMVSQRTGLSPSDAEKRVTDTFARMQAKAKEVETSAREAADKARKASAYAALWLFISLLVGAFSASWAATFGGRRRDQF